MQCFPLVVDYACGTTGSGRNIVIGGNELLHTDNYMYSQTHKWLSSKPHPYVDKDCTYYPYRNMTPRRALSRARVGLIEVLDGNYMHIRVTEQASCTSKLVDWLIGQDTEDTCRDRGFLVAASE